MRRLKLADNVILYHGDCRDILPHLCQVDLIFTDPPYGHNNNNGDLIHRRELVLGQSRTVQEARPIINDDPQTAKQLADWLFYAASKKLAPGACLCCCCSGGGPDPQAARWTLQMNNHLDFKQAVVWDKGPMGMGWHYRRSYEFVLVGQRRGAPCRWFDTSNKIENIIRPGTAGIRKIIPSDGDHPTPKPPELAQYFIRLHTKPGHIVLDPFMGGGSTAIAAIRERRRFIGIELDKHWFDLAVRKIKQELASPDIFRLPFRGKESSR